MPRRRSPKTAIEIARARIVRESPRLWRVTVQVRMGGWQSTCTASASTPHAALGKAFAAGLDSITGKMVTRPGRVRSPSRLPRAVRVRPDRPAM